MTLELLSMLGGGVIGFVFRFIAAQQEAAARALEAAIKVQGIADESADRAAARGTHVGRRVLVFTILWVLGFAPIFGAFFGIPTFIETPTASWDVFGIFTGGLKEISGIIILDEFRVGFVSCVGFYLGSSAVGKRS